MSGLLAGTQRANGIAPQKPKGDLYGATDAVISEPAGKKSHIVQVRSEGDSPPALILERVCEGRKGVRLGWTREWIH